MSLLITAAIALGSALLAGGGVHVYQQSKYDEMRACYQKKIDVLQRKIAELIEKIREKDQEMLRLMNRNKDLEAKLQNESRKRDEILCMIGALYEKQKRIESILHALVLIITLRIKNWNVEKLEIRKQLENANMKVVEVEEILTRLKEEKEVVKVQRKSVQQEREGLFGEQEKLTLELDKAKKAYQEV
jgi:chromosome segregation ATPase